MTRNQAHQLWDSITTTMGRIGINNHAVIISDAKPDDRDGDCDIQIVPKSVKSITFDWMGSHEPTQTA